MVVSIADGKILFPIQAFEAARHNLMPPQVALQE